MSESLNIKANRKGNVVVVALEGSLDADTAPRLEKAISKLVTDGERKVVCDLKSLKFISSAGLGTLSAARKKLKSADGDLRLASPTPEVLDVFELLSFTRIFSISPNLDEALKDF
ncbi:MAG TPA: anti-anti-sigma factor [Leptospiraceae bacterium]|nr:anti-anti-sigma factor [Spirochaetaceae bacterium]HBS05115.1 anti-anti-sigma factor [Leptospiraceae bacterium]|tara:strand:+ start:143 stop:487 length:345 start_codon:yes stop_codon:yes gene_type:complete